VTRIRLGKVVRAIGLRGYLGVAGTDGALGGLQRAWLEKPGGGPVEVKILEARPQGRVWAVQVEGVVDRTAAEGWVGAEVLATREDLGEAGEGRHYWVDLEGLPVVTLDGRKLGTVKALYETGGVDVLVVVGDEGERLIPLAPYVEVDVVGRRVVVDPPEGLLDLLS
jgi:16S rRNA processing protein RimM